MNIPRAIEISNLILFAPPSGASSDFIDAIKLGIEALKKIQYDRLPGNRPLYSTLPGETED